MPLDIGLDYEKIDATSKRLNSAVDTINPMLGDLKNDVSTLLDDGLVFQQSSPAMEEAYNKFNTNLTAAIEGIRNYAQQFNDIRTQIETMDGEWAAAIKNSGS
ncbi:hypothetical protein AB0K60_19790 [Thermopolyspora sp. NPDC052614]|uniref:WXG100 family type VII secretion target n=1 Tax=Thermopolyspora sp. NPDC052614 TaxID=3155682 RepID=UPI0034165359